MRCRTGHFAQLILVLGIFIFPVFAQAATCVGKGYTVVFINGVFDSKDQAQTDARVLGTYLSNPLNGESIVVKLGYNQTHTGLGDLLETALPAFDQYDLDTILIQMHADLTTRKVLLVGHSQGAGYANKIYEYLITHGVPKEDVAVYAVATPESYVAGGGKYITYTLDDVISFWVKNYTNLHPLPPNATFAEWFNSPDHGANSAQGHGFVDMYLGGFGTRIIGEMQSQLGQLKATTGTAIDGCFDPPADTFAHKAVGATLAVADPVLGAVGTAGLVVGKATVVVGQGTAAVIGAVGNTVGGLLGFGTQPAETKTGGVSGLDKALFALSKAVNGSSLNLKDLDELNGKSQGGAVALAFNPDEEKKDGQVLGEQTETQTPQEILPQPPVPGVGVVSPGFGGGGPAVVVATTEPQSAEATSTATSTSPSTPTFTTLYAQEDISTIGQTRASQTGGYIAGQRLGTGLSGTVHSVAYPVHATNLTHYVQDGWGIVQILNCQGDSGYVPIGHCNTVSTGSNVAVVAQTGNEATILVTMPPYVFEPTQYYWLRFITTDDMALYGSMSNSYGDTNTLAAWVGGADFVSYSMDTNSVVDWSFRICSTDTCGTFPAHTGAPEVTAATLGGAPLSRLYPSSLTMPIASTTQSVVVTFDKDIAVAPTIIHAAILPGFPDAVAQNVNDCADTDAKTFCFTFVPAAGFDDTYTYFIISDAQDALGQRAATTTYKFRVDTVGPSITPATLTDRTILPALTGNSTEAHVPIQILLNNIFYTVPTHFGVWSLTLTAGQELAEGVYAVAASSTDPNGNRGPLASWNLIIDLTPPVVTIQSPAEGEATTTMPTPFIFSSTDAQATTATCQLDNDGAQSCGSDSPFFLNASPGVHVFRVGVLDAARNSTIVERNFTVLP